MPNLVNIFGRTSADIIGSETTPMLSIENQSTGAGLVVTNSGAGIALRAVGHSSASGSAALQVQFSANVAGATVAPLQIIASTASQAFISFSGMFLSSASYGGLASTNAFVIPVYHESQRVFGYIGAQKALV